MAVNHIKEWAREVLSTTSSSPPSANNTDTDDETPKASQESDHLQHFVTAEETSGLTPPRPKPSGIPRPSMQHFRGRRQRSCGPRELEKGYKGMDIL